MSVPTPANPRIAMVITELDSGGAEKAFVRVACGLQQHGWQVTVFSLRDAGPLTAELQASGITVIALQCSSLNLASAVLRLVRHFRRLRPDLVLSFLHHANLAARLAAWWAGCRSVSGIRVADRRLLVTLPDRVTRRMVAHYIAVSRFTAEVHAQCCRIPPAKISYIRNGVDLTQIDKASPADRHPLKLSEEQFVVLFAGRMTQQKAPETVLHAIARLRHADPRTADIVRLLLVGDGPLTAQLKSIADTLKIADQVRFLGYREDLTRLMKICSLLVLPSRWEGLPNVISEAQAAGLPVAAAAVDGIPELISAGQTGQLFAAADPVQLEQVLSYSLAHPAELRRMADQARERMHSCGGWEQAIAQYHVQLQRILHDGREL